MSDVLTGTFELEYEGPTITVTPAVYDFERDEYFNNLRDQFASGIVDTVMGRVRMVEALLELRSNDAWKDDPIIDHYEEEEVGWKDYLRELIAWCKELHPTIQLSLSTLQNYLRYYNVFCLDWGLSKEKVFGAQEQTRRQLLHMVKTGYGSGEPLQLKNGYDEDKLPVVPEGGLRERVISVAETALDLPQYSPDLFEAYRKGTGHETMTCNTVIETDAMGYVSTWKIFVKKEDADGNPLASYCVNLMKAPITLDVLAYFEELGFTVETPE